MNNSCESDELSLNQQVMLNQFMSITGCTYEQSMRLLDSSDWQFQTALSIFFDDYSMLKSQNTNQFTNNDFNQNKSNMLYSNSNNFTSITSGHENGSSSSSSSSVGGPTSSITAAAASASTTSTQPHVPCSTPVTPPNLEFLEKAFSKLNNNSSIQQKSNIDNSVSFTSINNNLTCSNRNNNRSGTNLVDMVTISEQKSGVHPMSEDDSDHENNTSMLATHLPPRTMPMEIIKPASSPANTIPMTSMSTNTFNFGSKNQKFNFC